MKWNVKEIAFLYQPDVFSGTFSNPKMQERHEQEVEKKLEVLVTALSKEPNPLKAMHILHKKDQLQFFLNNKASFKLSGDLEKAFIALYLASNGPFLSDGKSKQWNEMFSECDPEALFSIGSPVTFETTTLYRGSISGFSKGLCWTPDKINVDYLAKRWSDASLSGGELFEVDVTKDDIMLYLEHPREEKIILSPEFIDQANIRPYAG